MALQVIRASTQRGRFASAFSSVGVQTVHLVARLRSLPTSDAFPNRFWLFGFGADGGAENRTPYLAIGATNVLYGFFNGGFNEQTVSVSHNTTDWVPYTIVYDFTAGTAILKLYRNGVQIGSTFSAVRGTVATSTITVIGGNERNGEHSDADFANFAFWDAELTAAEIAAVGKGISPARIRPQNLRRHGAMIRDVNEVRAGTPVTTVNGPQIVPHPRLYSL